MYLYRKIVSRINKLYEKRKIIGRNIIAAESRQKALDRMVKIDRPESSPGAISMKFSTAPDSANDVLFAERLKKGYGNRLLFEDLTFDVKKGDRLFISGANGCGKSTLIKILVGKEVCDGYFEFGYNVKIGYYDQENQNLSPEKTVLDELWDSYENLTQTEIRSALALFMFRGDDVFKQVCDLSGGERARLTMAKLILSKVNLLILDEPTNHLDISSRHALENALEQFDGTIIAVSHDRYFVKKLATRILDLGEADKKVFNGNYEEYKSYREARAERVQATAQDSTLTRAAAKPSGGKEQFLAAKEQAAQARRLEKRKKQVTEEIVRIEKELEEIAARLEGDEASDYVIAAELFERQTSLEESLFALYEENEGFAE